MRSKNLFLSLLFIAVSVLFCASIFAASVGLGSNVFNISEPMYSPGQTIDGILNVSFKDVPNDYIGATVDSNKFSMLLSDFLNAQPQFINYTCNPASCQSFYNENSYSTSQTYSIDETHSALFGLKIENGSGGCSNPSDATISKITFDITGSGARPLVDIGNDGTIDWQYLVPSESIDAQVSPSTYAITTSFDPIDLINGVEYCERIKLPLSSKFRLTANLTTDSNLVFRIYDLESTDLGSCPATAPAQECEIDTTIENAGNYYACVSLDPLLTGCDAENPCGTINLYSGTGNTLNGFLYTDSPHSQNGDFPIDVGYAGYQPLNGKVTTDDLSGFAQEYLLNASNCNGVSSCIIPVSISTPTPGSITLSNLNLLSSCSSFAYHRFSAIDESKAIINMNMTALQISVLNASSSKYGTNILTISIPGLLSKYANFEIAKVPEITSLGPVVVAAGTSTNFAVKAYSPKNNTIISYQWNFGDGGTDNTAVPSSMHSYNSVGTFNLTVTITDNEGLVGSKTFSIFSTSPGESINKTIATKKSFLAAFTSQYSSIPAWYKPLFAKFNITELSATLSKYETDAGKASTSDLIDIQQKLNTLAIPQDIIDAVKISDSVPIFSAGKISLNYVQKAGAGDYDENNADQIKNLIAGWQSQLGIQLSGTVKKVSTDLGEEYVATIITIKLNPMTEVDNLYLIVNLPSSVQFDDVTFESTAGKNLNGAIGFEITGGEQTINLAMAGNQNINLLEVYGSPNFETLMNAIPVETKCGNTICDTGENSQNCPSDCPPITKGITFIVLILVGAGVGIFLIWKVYAVIYERSQEMKIFKNRNDLISITMFIVNAKVRGMPEPEIREKLEKSGWNNEQIAFAFLKVEKRKKEIEKKIKEAKKLIEHKA